MKNADPPSLLELIDSLHLNALRDGGTDKHNAHSYIPHLYDVIFEKYREKKLNLLEIGVLQGGSLRLWKEYFVNGTIYGIDNGNSPYFNQESIPRDAFFFKEDAYLHNSLPPDLKFSIIIDDGSHKLKDMLACIEIYYPKLEDEGVLILEDILKPSWVSILKKESLKTGYAEAKLWDLTHIKKKKDDRALVLRKKRCK